VPSAFLNPTFDLVAIIFLFYLPCPTYFFL
jgi:hypothetical protein